MKLVPEVLTKLFRKNPSETPAVQETEKETMKRRLGQISAIKDKMKGEGVTNIGVVYPEEKSVEQAETPQSPAGEGQKAA